MLKPSLRTLLLFQNLAPDEADLLYELFEPERYDPGVTIFHQGDKAQKLHVLLSGKVEIRFKPHDGETLTVAEIRTNGVFGWSAALGRKTYTSDAVTTVRGHGISVRGDQLRAFCEDHPATGAILLERLAEAVSTRVGVTYEKVVELLQQGVSSSKNHSKGAGGS